MTLGIRSQRVLTAKGSLLMPIMMGEKKKKKMSKERKEYRTHISSQKVCTSDCSRGYVRMRKRPPEYCLHCTANQVRELRVQKESVREHYRDRFPPWQSQTGQFQTQTDSVCRGQHCRFDWAVVSPLPVQAPKTHLT